MSQEQRKTTKLCFLDNTHPKDELVLSTAFHSLPGGPQAHNFEYGESWQYMGTVYGWEGRTFWVHQFRHRAHPDFDNERQYRNIYASPPRPEIQAKAF